MLTNVGLDLNREEDSTNSNALHQECRELTLDEVTKIAGGIDWGRFFKTEDMERGPRAVELWGGSVGYSNGGGQFVGMDDASTGTCHSLP